MGEVVRLTLLALTPGASDDVVRNTLTQSTTDEDEGAQTALCLAQSWGRVCF